jgi:uncharacterized protein (TIGR02678 family)
VSALAEQVIAERRQAMRALLARPLLAASGSDGESLALVRQHAVWLREWLGRNCGWMLQIEPELARLRKTPGDLADATRGAIDRTSGIPFSRRRYALFCLALAALERADRQITLGNVARDVLSAVVGEPAFAVAGLTFDLDGREARRDLVHVVRLLLDLRVLVRVHGQEEHFVERRGDVLYNVNRPALAALLSVRRGPSTIAAGSFEDRIAAIVEEPIPDGEEARNHRLRVTLTRRLLDDPVMYYDDLNVEERAYLTSQRAHLLRQIQEATGLLGETRREGIALVDPDGVLTDQGMPDEGTEGHATLLVAEFLAAEARRQLTRNPQTGSEPNVGAVPMAAVVAHLAVKKREHRTHWRKDALLPGAEVPLAREAFGRLEALRLVRRMGDGVMPLPALGRFRLLPPTVRPPRERRTPTQKGLFE